MNGPNVTEQPDSANAGCVQRVVSHSGDCSIFGYGMNVCDCGALRNAIIANKDPYNDELYKAWVRHLDGLHRSG